MPLAEAHIDPQDRGFLFGDALYEAIKVVAGTVLDLEPHLGRLETGLQQVDIEVPRHLPESCRQLVAASELQTGYLYLQVTRGAAARVKLPPVDLEPTVLILPYSRAFEPFATRPMRALSVPDWRWHRCDLKSTSLMGTVLGKLRVRDRALDEVLFVGPGGDLREGGSTNLFVRQGEGLETHPLDGHILAGVTRATVLQLAADLGLPCMETVPRLESLGEWSEACLCGTLTGIQPLVELDGRQVADGRAGPWTRRLAAALAARERDLIATDAG
jgi:D-alanine transaminase